MRPVLFLLLIPCLMIGKANAQVTLQIEGHVPFAMENLGVLADGTGFGGLVAATYPVMYSGMVNLVGKAGFNHYGTYKDDLLFEGDIAIDIDVVYQGIPIAGGLRLYNRSRRFYLEGLIGVEFKRGDFDYYDFKDETYITDMLTTFGGGISVWRGLGIAASFSMSNDLWRYGNLGLSYRFGE